jgi:NAD(P)-dependent dehydrogenase (short-subunit alcohol dehydrogenase family)
MCCARSAGSTTQLALVTGTSSGIGLSVARRLLDRGWQVIGMARRPAEIEHPQYRHLGIDLADLSHAASTVEQEVAPLVGDSRWQRVGLVNNAANPDLLTSVEQIDPVALLRVYACQHRSPCLAHGVCHPAESADHDSPYRQRVLGRRSGGLSRPRCIWQQ